MSKTRLAVFFGGVSVEHEVSVITGVQLMKHADREKYEIIPIYIDKAGRWWTGNQLESIDTYQNQDLFAPQGLTPFTLSQATQPQLSGPTPASLVEKNPVPGSDQPQTKGIDVAILCFHGGYGESGSVQGLLELARIPYQGPSVTSSAIAFDKIVTRQILAAEGIHQTDYVWFTQDEWNVSKSAILARIKKLGLPVFIKPANGGSTVGIEKVKNSSELAGTIERVLQYDQRILIEAEIKNCIEVNVSVLGWADEVRASVPEQPIKADEFLSYADKYERGGKKSGMASASRRIPAPISASLTSKLQDLAKKLFHIFDCSGVVRIDFFVDPSEETIYVVELNTIPGSMSYYLWEATGLKYPQLIDELVSIAQKRFAAKKSLITSFESNILQKSEL